MFPFKVQLFQGCKSETEPINTKSVVQYHKADTKYCWQHKVSYVNCVIY
jgi:hypothetical protein